MTLPYERTRAVLNTEQFLRDLLDRKKTPGVPKYIRERVQYCLRHYPTEFEMDMVIEREEKTADPFYKVFGHQNCGVKE